MTTDHPPFYAVAAVNLTVDRPEFGCASGLDMDIVFSYEPNDTMEQVRNKVYAGTQKLMREAYSRIESISLAEADELIQHHP